MWILNLVLFQACSYKAQPKPQLMSWVKFTKPMSPLLLIMYFIKNMCSHKYICNNLSKFVFWNTRYGMKQQIRSCSKLTKMEWTILNKIASFPPKWFCNKAEKIENCLLFCLISNHYWNIEKL